MSPSSLDAFIEQIVREVIRRLRAEEAKRCEGGKEKQIAVAHHLSDKLITAASIAAIPQGTSEITIMTRAILTPLARDDARDRGIRIVRKTAGVNP